MYIAGLKPGWVISSGSTGSSFIPDQVGQIWFINYLGLTQILIWISYLDKLAINLHKVAAAHTLNQVMETDYNNIWE